MGGLVGGVGGLVGGCHGVNLHGFLHSIPKAFFYVGGNCIVLRFIFGYERHGLVKVIDFALLEYPGDIGFVLEATDVCPEQDALLRRVVLAPLSDGVSESGHVVEAPAIASGGFKGPLLKFLNFVSEPLILVWGKECSLKMGFELSPCDSLAVSLAVQEVLQVSLEFTISCLSSNEHSPGRIVLGETNLF